MRKHGLAIFAAFVMAVCCSTLVAFGAPQLQNAMRKMPGMVPVPQASAARSALSRPLPPFPPMPRGTGHVRRVRSATGACIQFSFNTGCTSSGSVNQNYVAGQSIAWQSLNLPSAGNIYQDYVLAPNSGTPAAVGATYATASGAAHSQASAVNGIYVFGALNTTTNSWDAIAYVLVGSGTGIATYSNGALATKTETFTTSSTGAATVYVGTTGLTPQDVYAVGIEEQLTGKCVFTAPSSTQTTTPTTLCNLAASAVTGANPTGAGVLVANWGFTLSGTTSGYPQPGTYIATVYDQTTGTRVASRQFVVVDGRSTSTARVSLQFNNGVSTSAASTQRIAYNGTASSVNDPSQTGMNLYFGATGLSGTNTYNLVVSDPNGNVAKTFTATGATSSITPSNNSWALPAQTVPFEQAYPGSTWAASIYDTVNKKLTAAQSFQVLGYSASIKFDSPSSTDAQIPTNSTIAEGITFTNTAELTFGTNNGDPLTKIVTTATNVNTVAGITLTPPSTGVTCTPVNGTDCTGTYSDSNGQSWTARLSCGAACGTYSITLTPTSVSTTLAPGASIDVTGLVFSESGNGCKNICTFDTSLTAQDMISGVSSGGTSVANPITIEESPGGSQPTGTASVKLQGFYNSAGAYVGSKSAGYTPRFNQSIFANNQPFTNASSKIVLAYTLDDTSSTKSISVFSLGFPSAITPSTVIIDPTLPNPNGATATATGTCGGVSNPAVCITLTTAISGGTSQTFYLDMTPPSAAFSYTDIVGTIVNAGTNIAITAAASSDATFIGSPTSVDSTAIGAYSLDGGLMLGAVTPGSVGTNATNNLSFTVRNTQSGANPFPDQLDFVVMQVPNQSYISVPAACSGLTVNTPGWSCVNATSGSGQPTTYYFGQCPQQISPLPIVPATSTSFGTDNMTICPFALPNEPYSLVAGGTLSVTVPVTSGATSTGSTPVTVSAWAHGADTNGWTTPINSAVAVTPSAAAGVGFSAVTGAGGTLQTVATGSEPQIVANFISGTPYYNQYVYKIRNTGTPAITAITIAIPGQDSTGSNGQDASGNLWNVSSVTLYNESTGTSNGCTVTTVQNPVSGTDTTGNMTISCPSTGLISGQTLDVQFNASAPLKVNSTYNFLATINGSASAASPNWFADESVLIALSASISVVVNSNASATSCPASVALSPAAATVAFGSVTTNSSVACPDAMYASVTTDASSPTLWALYVSASNNPATTGGVVTSPNELNVATDPTNASGTAASSVPCPTSITPPCFAYDNATYTPMALTSSGAGTRLGYTNNGGMGASNSPVKIFVNLKVTIGTETIPATGQSATLTYTWIAN